jgi:hypothetical protein
MESQTHRRDDMLKKSLFVAALLVSTAFGAGTFESAEELDLAGITKIVEQCSPILKGVTSADDASYRIAALNKVAAVLQSNPEMMISAPTTITGIGNILAYLGDKDGAKRLYKFDLGLDRGVFGFSMVQSCFKLHTLGESDLAIETLRSFIEQSSLTFNVRQDAISYFYQINKDAHRDEARELWASLQVQAGRIATIEEARKTAKDHYLTDEEIKAQNLDAVSDDDVPPLEAA